MKEIKTSIFYKYLCDYVLGNIWEEYLIDAALEAVTEGFETRNLYILAGLSKTNYDYYDALHYFEMSLIDLGLEKPTKKEAAEYLTFFYCNQLVNNKIDSETFLKIIMSDIYHKTWNDFNSTKFVGDYLGLEKFISAYWEINDLENEMVQFSIEINREKELARVYNSCKNLAENYLHARKI